MIETLGSRTASTNQEDPPVPALTIAGITFEDGDLSRPRYGSLIDQDHAPEGVQFEPCLQIRGVLGELKVRFEIAAADVRFVADGEDVRVSSIFDPQELSPPGLVSAMLVDGDPKKCDLVWNQSEADDKGFGQLNTLRLHCRFEDSRLLSPVEEVEGGLYLAILNQKEALYDEPPNQDQVAVSGFLPAGHAFQLRGTTVGPFGGQAKKKSAIKWTQETGRQHCVTSNPDSKKCYCIVGQASSFGLIAAPDGQLVPDPGKMASLDPTVIQPPNCTSGGICITP